MKFKPSLDHFLDETVPQIKHILRISFAQLLSLVYCLKRIFTVRLVQSGLRSVTVDLKG